MLIDLNDPASIAAWVRVRPREHWELLRQMVRLQPKWRESARAAQEMLREPSNARLAALGQNPGFPVGRR